jgi:threonine dehydrogenase-like Zn-dependent dehydrogenase
MKALCWMGKTDVRVETVPDPEIQEPGDAIIQISSTAICGSDLHIYDGYIPTMEKGDILGHEFMGEVVSIGKGVKKLKVGDRVVVPFTISCGKCYFCKKKLFSLCDTSNPNAELAEKVYGQSPAGLFGYSHMMGGFAGGQAEYARVPHADVGPVKVANGLSDDQVLFLSDIFPTGYMAAENCQIKAGDTVAVWGCGPVGQMAIRSAFLFGAERVFAIDRVPERLEMARQSGALTIDDHKDVVEELKQETGDRGPDACIDAVGMEAHGEGLTGMYDKVKQTLRLETDRATALREVIQACRKGGTVSLAGVYAGWVDKMPVGAMFNKGLTIRGGQTHVQKYMPKLLTLIDEGAFDPSFVITHRMPLDAGPEMYKTFRDKQDGCIKVVLKPGERSAQPAEVPPSA